MYIDFSWISSYVLFTMDKLVVRVTRQLQAMMCSEPCAKLLSLFMYETVRPQGMLESVYPFYLSFHSLSISNFLSPFCDMRRYHASCAELLREERMFLFEFEQVPRPGRYQFIKINTIRIN